MKKKVLLILFLTCVFFIILSLNLKSNAASLDKTEVNLYAVNPDLLREFPELKIPSNYATEYQIKVNDTTQNISNMGIYTRGDDGVILAASTTLEIDKTTGIIKPRLRNVVSDGEIVGTAYNFQTEIVYVKVDDQELSLKVNVIDYSKEYVEQQLKTYINQNFSNLSDYDKALAITKYVAQNYDYSVDYQSFRDMYLYKCGDCLASANLINKMCELSGLQSHTRNGNRDMGAGSGHENNAILIDGKVYIADAGYSGTKQTRPYDFYLEDPAYTCKENSDGTITLLQYDGFETETLEVPSQIKGKTITAIASNFYNSNTIKPKKIVLPDTIKTIEDLAFYTRENILESINIPKSVTSIGYGVFLGCKKVDITIESGGNFVIENNAIYNKEKTVLIEVLEKYNGDTTFTIPSTVKKITKEAFFCVTGVKYVVFPSGLEEISQEAFYGSEIEALTIPKTIKKIGYAAFASNDKIISIEIEDGCTAQIGDCAFASCYFLSSAKIPNTITNIGEDAFYNTDDEFTIYGVEQSTAQTYASDNNIKFSSGKINIINRFVTMGDSTLIYETNKNIRPTIEVKYLGNKLIEGTDYSITYDTDANKPGNHQLVIKGIGKFSGEVIKNYKINKGTSLFNFICTDIVEGEKLNTQIVNPANQDYYCFISNERGYSVQEPAEPGVYTYHFFVYSNDYYSRKNNHKNINYKQGIYSIGKT